jgi:hypothetical protein
MSSSSGLLSLDAAMTASDIVKGNGYPGRSNLSISTLYAEQQRMKRQIDLLLDQCELQQAQIDSLWAKISPPKNQQL